MPATNSEMDPIRSSEPSLIDVKGFAECQGLIPSQLCAEIAREPMVREARGAAHGTWAASGRGRGRARAASGEQRVS